MARFVGEHDGQAAPSGATGVLVSQHLQGRFFKSVLSRTLRFL
jgi:hypothetical protein